MASVTPEYFLPRHWDYPPTGPIKLGNVFTSIKEPHRPISTVKPDHDAIITSSKKHATIETGRTTSKGVTMITTFLSALIGAGGDVGFDADRNSERIFTFDCLDTNYIDTSNPAKYQAYVESCVNDELVSRYLRRANFRKQVYVITGIKTVSGAKFQTMASRDNEVLLGVQVDGTALSGGAAPIGGGPEIHAGKATKLNVSWDGTTDFVLAFKVSKISVKRTGDVKDKDHLKGAFLDSAPEHEEQEQLGIDIVPQPDIEAGFSAFPAQEGEEIIDFGVLDDGDEDDD